MCGAHNVSFVFWAERRRCCRCGGANKAVQTISVFVASLWFGPEHPEHVTTKVFALILVDLVFWCILWLKCEGQKPYCIEVNKDVNINSTKSKRNQ